jgi:cytochrome P450 / NADPH-cytochrome P450 reductase
VLTLISGHETTSGVLSFVIHSLLTTPDAYAKLRAEVDSVIGDRVVTLEDIAKMPYLTGTWV